MIVAAHQPNFLPWLGFFDKMRRAEIFVVVDHVQFERHNFQNRTKIKTPNGPLWLTVPVVQRSQGERIVDKAIDNSRVWSRKMAKTLSLSYSSAPHVADYAPRIAEILEGDWERLVDLNIRLIEFCREALGITTPLVRSSELEITGAKSEMVLNLCRTVGADVYLSGTGGCKEYLDIKALEAGGVSVQWQDFNHPRYAQHPRREEFVEKLSALDLLLNCGPRSAELMREGSSQGEAARA